MREEAITALCQVAGAITQRLASRQDTVPPPNTRIVVLRRCCLGDVLGSTALLDALRRAYPWSRIDYATGPWSRPALENNPDINVCIDPEISPLRRGHYDVAITLDRSPKAGMLPWLAAIPIRVGPNSLGRGFAHNLRVACPPDRSEAELALDCAAAIGVDTAGARAKFCPTASDKEFAKIVPTPYAVIAPGGGLNPGMALTTKRWPPESFAKLAGALKEAFGLDSVLVGAGSDAGPAAEVTAVAPASVRNLAGQTSFGQMAALIQRARVFVGNDSAPLHLAAAVGCPFVGIYGPSDPIRHRPFGSGEVVAAPLDRSTYRNGFASLDCIGMVDVAQVLDACRRVLG